MASWIKLQAWYGSCSLRERALIALTVLAGTWGLWSLLVGESLSQDYEAASAAVSALSGQVTTTDEERQQLLRQDADDRRTQLENEISRLQTQLAHQQHKLNSGLSRCIDPEDVPEFLEDLLREHKQLQLVRLSSRPGSLIESPDGDDQAPTLYRHPVEIELLGQYGGVHAYLQDLQDARWQLQWRRISYAVDDYPQARIVLEVETLSHHPEWLGV